MQQCFQHFYRRICTLYRMSTHWTMLFYSCKSTIKCFRHSYNYCTSHILALHLGDRAYSIHAVLPQSDPHIIQGKLQGAVKKECLCPTPTADALGQSDYCCSATMPDPSSVRSSPKVLSIVNRVLGGKGHYFNIEGLLRRNTSRSSQETQERPILDSY